MVPRDVPRSGAAASTRAGVQLAAQRGGHGMSTTSVRQIPFSRPDFDDAETRAVAEVLASGWVSQGPKVARFEELFAERVGARHGVAVTSCTTALHLALVLAGVGPGDEVICPS